ncbi:MAG: AraC family transcriptional regulator [Lachnospiraceae bacterium]|nr:AraC family transcriptional regulator [Lachnospiraceae bacterium]
MKLYTERKANDYERIVDIYIDKSENSLPYINDTSTCKLIILKKGTISFCINDSFDGEIPSPSAIFLSNTDKFLIHNCKFKATTIYFKPSVINDSFEYDNLTDNGENYDTMYATTIHQDYLLIRNFLKKESHPIKSTRLSDDSLLNITRLIRQMEKELSVQYDGFWPCRSRSYFIELLFTINFCYSTNPYTLESYSKLTTQIIDYLNQHISDIITLDTLTNQFHINRNTLNDLFIQETGMTCLSFLLSLRMDLAKLWLRETEIPIAEIAQRLSYLDSNYFTKVFRKSCGCSPSEYRNQ